MSSTSSKKSASTASKTSTKSTSSKAKAPIKKVPSPDEVAPKTMMNPKPKFPVKPDGENTGLPAMAGGAVLKKQELIEKVVRTSGIKKKDAKPVVEAMLEVLGEALADGREFNLQPLGKLKLNRTKETPNARIIVAKIRQPKKTNTPTPPLAAAAE